MPGRVLRIGRAFAAGILISIVTAGAGAEPVRVGSKNFTEQFIVAEIYAAALESGGLQVERKLNLGGTLIAHNALINDEVDLYPEYTGTALKSVLKLATISDPVAAYVKVKKFYEAEFEVTWLDPTGINNGNALLVRSDTARRHRLKTLSDLTRVAPRFRIGAGPEFADRNYGLPGLKERYGIEFAGFVELGALALRYDALEKGQIEVVNGFATDWQIASGGFATLDDDRHLFAPYQLAPAVRLDALRSHPRIGNILNRTSAWLTNAEMRELNRRVEAGGETPRNVAKAFLNSKGLIN